MATAEYVQVKMQNGLTGIPSHICHHAITRLAQATVGSDLLAHHEQMRK